MNPRSSVAVAAGVDVDANAECDYEGMIVPVVTARGRKHSGLKVRTVWQYCWTNGNGTDVSQLRPGHHCCDHCGCFDCGNADALLAGTLPALAA